MRRRPGRYGLPFYVALLALLAAWPLRAGASQVARQDTTVRITAVDIASFPAVHTRVLVTGPGSAPVAGLSELLLRENGVPIPETTLAQVPVGVDLIFVLDANVDFLQVDGRDEVTRRDKVAQSIGRFAAQFMDPAGLDRVSVITPDATRESPSFLIEGTGRPDELAAAVAAYQPAPLPDAPLRATPLQAMLTAAVDDLAQRRPEGRFQAVLLFTDGARLGRQIDYPALTEAAVATGIPLFVALLGSEVSPEELANAGGLYEPTRGQYVHMPEPEAADPLYTLFAAHGWQAELVYRSAARENGEQQISVSLGNVRDTTTYSLSLEAPQVTLELPGPVVRRSGNAADTPLPLLQPGVLSLTARIDWPDGRPRGLSEIIFRVDGRPQPLGAQPAPDAAGQIPLAWDLSERDAGAYRLSVEVVDELGFSAASAPVDITIEVSRPAPATPTTEPTPPPPLAGRALGVVPGDLWLLLAPLAAFVALLWLWRRARRARGRPPAPQVSSSPVVASGGPDRRVPVLVWESDGAEDQIELLASDVTLGREPGEVDIVLEDPSVSRLHARVRRTGEDQYWLYDEGSILGTFLNHERLGLAPRPLQHGDVIRIGHVNLRFRLEVASPRQPDTADAPPAEAGPGVAPDRATDDKELP